MSLLDKLKKNCRVKEAEVLAESSFFEAKEYLYFLQELYPQAQIESRGDTRCTNEVCRWRLRTYS